MLKGEGKKYVPQTRLSDVPYFTRLCLRRRRGWDSSGHPTVDRRTPKLKQNYVYAKLRRFRLLSSYLLLSFRFFKRPVFKCIFKDGDVARSARKTYYFNNMRTQGAESKRAQNFYSVNRYKIVFIIIINVMNITRWRDVFRKRSRGWSLCGAGGKTREEQV